MINAENVNVKLIKKVSSVLFDALDTKNKKFAKNIVKNWNPLEAYNIAFEDVQKVRASYLLQDPGIWQLILQEMKSKPIKTVKESEILETFDLIVSTFDISPISLFIYYVQESDNGQSIATILNADCVQSFTAILYTHYFFILLDREYFYSKTKTALIQEIGIIKASGRQDEMNYILKKTARVIDIDDFDSIF